MTKSQDKTDTPDTAEFKKAAQALSKFLAARGTALSHAVALEALSASLGVKNWRTLRAKLQAPASVSTAIPARASKSDVEYSVEAIYRDNNQLYGDVVTATSPLAAAIYVQLERLTDAGSATEVSVTHVLDDQGKMVLSPSFLTDLDLVSPREAVRKACSLARERLGPPPARGVLEADEWDARNRAISFWEAICSDEQEVLGQAFDELIEDTEFDAQEFSDDSPEFEDEQGVHVVEPAQLLQLVVSLARQGLDLKEPHDAKFTGVFQVLQLQEMLEMHEDRIAVVFNGECVQG